MRPVETVLAALAIACHDHHLVTGGSGMQLQALHDLVGHFALGMKSEPGKIKVFGRNNSNRGAIVDIIIGRE